MQFLIDKDTELSLNKITEIIMKFETGEKIRLNKYVNYYSGKQDILQKYVQDTTKPCNRIVTNYCYNIVQNYQGYLTGQDVTYSSEQDISIIQDILNYNDVSATDNELLRNALIFGKAFEIAYIDEDKKQRFKVLDSRECIPIYDNTLNQELMYVIRYYAVDTTDATKGYNVELYDKGFVHYFKSDCAYSSLNMVAEVPHYFKQVPVTIFSLNRDEVSVFDKIMSLQDAYNNLLSSEVDDFQAFCDAYLVLKGMTAEPEDIRSMKEDRVLLLPADDAQGSAGAEASYLSKNISDTQIENMLRNINDTIHKIAASPDFSQESFGTSSGIALRFRLLGFENSASSIVKNMTKSLQKRIELICDILNLTGEKNEALWRDIKIIFTRNLPVDNMEAANMVNVLRGLVSDKTLLAQLPFITDIDREIELVEAQAAANVALYSFAPGNEEVSNDTEE